MNKTVLGHGFHLSKKCCMKNVFSERTFKKNEIFGVRLSYLKNVLI